MMKKLLLLLTALMLLAAPAMAQEADLFLLKGTASTGETVPVGSAVLLDEITFMTNNAMFPDDVDYPLYAVNESGSYEILGGSIPNATSDIVLLDAAEAVPGTLIWADDLDARNAAVIRGHNSQGEALEIPVTSAVQLASYKGREIITFSCAEQLLPGATLYDKSGALMGLVVAEWGDRLNGLVALTVETIDLELGSDVYADENPFSDEIWYDDFAINYENGLATLDWSGCAQYDPTATHVVFVAYDTNAYYTYDILEPGVTEDEFFVAPGSWGFWVKQTHREDPMENDSFYGQYPLFLDVEAEPYTSHSFQSAGCTLGYAPVETGEVISGWVDTVDKITMDMLTNPDQALYIQLHDTYSVTENIEEPTCLTLFTPDACLHLFSGSYIFSPEGNAGDIYAFSVDSLLEEYVMLNETGTFVPGEYVLSYYISGGLASQISFTLE